MADSSAPISIHIPPQGYEELESLAEYATRLSEVISATANVPLNADGNAISAVITAKIGVNPAVAKFIFSGLSTLYDLTDEIGGNASDLLKAIQQSLSFEAPEEWRTKHLQKLQEASDRIVAALEEITPDHPLLMRKKSLELTYIHQNIYRRSRIITDLRPVFNVAGDDIRAMVLTHVLSIEYFDGVRAQRIEFALDEPDVAALKQATERAQTKTDATRKKFTSCGWTLIVAGDSHRTTAGAAVTHEGRSES